ncbi:c-type cytochrome biogenesis protein CcmI [Frigidibacter sp. MR17.24]|uniref:c-type cytochrome biogenesis protein CcmI n=1 Tax=Frigidibacter sp. MR17.24 TaxID=3127345 RepID=UPI003012DAE2
MLFWIFAVGAALAVALLMGRALMRPAAGPAGAAAFDLSVYRGQMAEIERDRARGTLSPEDAERARTDIGRKILDADRRLATETVQAQPRGATLAVAGIGAAVIAGAFLLYGEIGAPGYGDLPMRARMATAQTLYASRLPQAEAEAAARDSGAVPEPAAPSAEVAELMTRLRAVVAERPGDVQGLTLLARNEAALGNFAAAAAAQGQLIAAKGAQATPEDHAMQAEAMILAAGGLVSPEAEAALRAALAADPKDQTARYYMGLMLAQSGRPDQTFRIWAELLDEGPADAPWAAPIRSAMPELAWVAGEPDYQLPKAASPSGSLPGPSQADVAATADMAPEDRQQMIRGMVERLNDRLASEGGSAEEWARLVAALGVLGETDRARAIYAEAQTHFAGRKADLQALSAAAEQAGILQ